MIPIMTLRAVLLAALAGVQGLSVVSAGDRTNVLIETDGQVSYEHQLLTSPPRIVVDISGTEFGLPQRRFMDINRGGVLALRSSQYQPDVVRVVVDLAEAVDYEVVETNGVIRISFSNPAGAFEAWTSAPGDAARVATRMGVEPAGMDEPAGEPVRAETVARPADRAAAPVQVSQPVVVEAQEPEQPRITVEFREVPIVDVLNTFADFSQRSIVPGQGVDQQTITAAIREQPWDEAMRAILEGQGLVASELPSGIIMVTSLQNRRQLEQQEEIVTESFHFQYVTADSVAPQVRELLASGIASQPEAGQQAQAQTTRGGNVAVNAATNSIIVSARQSVLDRLRPTIQGMDQAGPQITVQVRILSLRRSEFDGLGVHYEFKDFQRGTMINRQTPGWEDTNLDGVFQPDEAVLPPSEQVNITGYSVAAVGNALERIPNATFDIVGTLLLGRFSLVTWVDAVERLELAELQADPVVTVRENRTARVHVGERTPIRTVDAGAQGASGPVAQVTTEETGVILEITPRVVGTNQVNLAIHAERSEIQSFSADAGYVFGTQETETEILLDDGQTAVISGLTTTDLRNTEQGIPILMNLPFVGALFRNTFTTEEKEDLLIMVTPYIDRPSR